jgi:hypothetical protein
MTKENGGSNASYTYVNQSAGNSFDFDHKVTKYLKNSGKEKNNGAEPFSQKPLFLCHVQNYCSKFLIDFSPKTSVD